MTQRRFLSSHVRRVAVIASLRLLVVLVASRACGDRYVWGQSSRGRRPGDIDVASSAFQQVLSLAALMTESGRNPTGCQRRHECNRGFVTAAAIVVHGFLIFPVATETRVVTVRRGLKELTGLIGGRGDRRGWAHQFIVPLMADGAVVVVNFLFIILRE